MADLGGVPGQAWRGLGLWYPGQPETELRHRLATCGEAANPQSRSDKSSHIAVDGNFSSTVQLGRGKGPASAGAHGRKEGTSALGGCRRHGRHASELQGKQQLLLPDAKRREESGRCQRAGANEPERAGGSWQRRWWKRNRPREAPQAGGGQASTPRVMINPQTGGQRSGREG
jgi:hypothetical protein